MAPLDTRLRGGLETTILTARADAERGAEAALSALAVGEDIPHAGLDADGRTLRNQLRARARILGESGGVSAGMRPLIEEVAYEQWHRMLFARFLAENELLMHPSGVAVTLEECEELAVEECEPDAWALAARFGAAMLPGIFKLEDPAHRVRFAPNDRIALERRLSELPRALFTADDGLGWLYQYWQSAKKNAVNESGRKVGGADIPPVTQLFTEDYMVRFLLENTLGAWWLTRHPNSPLVTSFTYLRCDEEGRPVAGAFQGWPDRAAEITYLDPCCGSGHFLESAFRMLVAMRMEEEGLDAAAAGDEVLKSNVFGLELDPRCVQLAAFALALSAWKSGGGYRVLPAINLACSGIPVVGQLEEWKRLAGADINLAFGLEQLFALFRQAPDIGSLLDPLSVQSQNRMFAQDFARIAPLLDKALALERTGDPVAAVFGNSASAVTHAAELLGREYTLVATNVPYLTRSKQSDALKTYVEYQYPDGKADLSTAFVERCRSFTSSGGTYAIVTPQNWLFLKTYESLRRRLFSFDKWNTVALLGMAAFSDMNWWAFNTCLLIADRLPPSEAGVVHGIDASTRKGPSAKSELVRSAPIAAVSQRSLVKNPDARFSLHESEDVDLLAQFADGLQGIATADYPRFGRCFWEVKLPSRAWSFQQSTVVDTQPYGGREHVLLWENGRGALAASPQARIQGLAAIGKRGVAVGQMGQLPCTLFDGDLFDNNTAVIIPKDPSHLAAIWSFCSSPDFNRAVRRIDSAVKVTNATLVKIPFDLARWQQDADEQYPDGLPQPISSDPTQWVFKGHPVGSTHPLQVAMARLLGFRWPGQEPDDIDRTAGLVDRDGVVCVPAVAGELPVVDRLHDLLAASYGAAWTSDDADRLVSEAGLPGRSLETWVRDAFFEQHCRVFLNRPFIWQIWDERPDGFSALLNCHRLDAALLDRVIYTYLGAWIENQQRAAEAGVAGADGRLVSALNLQKRLKLIREGEAPYDIYVRWKPLREQPIGWEPDLDDGVRLNIRPFVEAGVLRRKFTINWNKDRGANPDGSERINDRHLTLAEKRAARAAHGVPA